jgi:hypothetical protein
LVGGLAFLCMADHYLIPLHFASMGKCSALACNTGPSYISRNEVGAETGRWCAKHKPAEGIVLNR